MGNRYRLGRRPFPSIAEGRTAIPRLALGPGDDKLAGTRRLLPQYEKPVQWNSRLPNINF